MDWLSPGDWERCGVSVSGLHSSEVDLNSRRFENVPSCLGGIWWKGDR